MHQRGVRAGDKRRHRARPGAGHLAAGTRFFSASVHWALYMPLTDVPFSNRRELIGRFRHAGWSRQASGMQSTTHRRWQRQAQWQGFRGQDI